MTPSIPSLSSVWVSLRLDTGARCFLAAFATSCFFSGLAPAASVTILHSFADGTVPNDGANPSGSLIQTPDGDFYGTTRGTALNPDGAGAIFKMTLGGTVSTVHTFTGPFVNPGFQLVFANGNLIGITQTGGFTNGGLQYGFGTIFSTTLSGQTEFLYRFTGKTGAAAGPSGALVLGPGGELYGVTAGGGSNSTGTAFKFNAATKQLTILASFFQYSSNGALLLGQDGNFYGITAGAVIFMLTPGGTLTTLYTFPGITYGVGPLVQDAAGNFYGATQLNGTYSDGIVFKMTPQHTVTILHSFGASGDGFFPNAVVIGPDGNLYGTTTGGGSKDAGVLYQLSTDGSTYNIVHHFFDGSIQNDGYSPEGALLVGSDNNLYGVTLDGGSLGLGVIFKVTLL
jgi:uncharacterized repeat protein (TIGR03803 family)